MQLITVIRKKLLFKFIKYCKMEMVSLHLNMTTNKTTPINELILSEMKKQDVSLSAMAKKLDLSVNAIYNTLKKPSIQTDRLAQISEILQVNFFKILAGQLNIANPINPQIEKLTTENKTLKEVIRLLGGNK